MKPPKDEALSHLPGKCEWRGSHRFFFFGEVYRRLQAIFRSDTTHPTPGTAEREHPLIREQSVCRSLQVCPHSRTEDLYRFGPDLFDSIAGRATWVAGMATSGRVTSVEAGSGSAVRPVAQARAIAPRVQPPGAHLLRHDRPPPLERRHSSRSHLQRRASKRKKENRKKKIPRDANKTIRKP